MMLDAKIGGMTPAMLSFSGRWLLCACVHRAALLALGVVDRDAPLAALDEHHEGGDGERQAEQEQHQ